MSIFRLWQPHSDEYMLVWNSLVAVHTLRQLSESKRAEVYEHYGRIAALNRLDPIHDVTAHAAYDPFWLAFTMADLGIPPLLGPKTAKWFYVVNPRRARAVLFERGRVEQIADKVLGDIKRNYGLSLDLDSLSLELESPSATHGEPEVEQRGHQQVRPPADPKTAAEIDALLAEVRGETKRDTPPEISREQALAVFHERYRKSLVRWFDITETLPHDAGLYEYDGPTNCWFVQFCLTYDDLSIGPSRLVAVSKSTGEIVYDDSANDEA
jgi:hypothetical protein